MISIIISFVFIQVCSAKQQILGKITSRFGDVYVKGAKEIVWKKAKINMTVNFGDNIMTKEDSEAIITLIDETLLKVHSNTRVALNSIISPLEKKNSVLLFFGKIWNKVKKKIAQKRGFEVHSVTAVIGVRGTEIEVAAYEDGTMIVVVDSGKVNVDNEENQSILSSNQGTQISFDVKDIKTEVDFKPEWDEIESNSRKNLFADGRKYGGHIHDEIYKRRDSLKDLVDRITELKEKKKRYLSLAKEAEESGDEIEYESYMSKISEINREILELNKKIAFSGNRLECHFGLFSHYGDLAKDPVLSKKFRGKEFILEQLDNIEMIHAEFNAMIEEGMKLSMEDMEDLMDEMRGKVRKYREKKEKKDIFEEMD